MSTAYEIKRLIDQELKDLNIEFMNISILSNADLPPWSAGYTFSLLVHFDNLDNMKLYQVVGKHYYNNGVRVQVNCNLWIYEC